MSQHVTIGDVASVIESFAPLYLQEGYDNSGLQVGSMTDAVTGVLICLDVTLSVVDEAMSRGCNLIVSHHPVIFKGLKQLSGKTDTERIVIKAIQNNIGLYSAHTNVDVVRTGVSGKMCEKLGLENCQILSPLHDQLLKLVTFVPASHGEPVRKALFDAGAGHIGNYDACSYSLSGEGTFRALEGANPFVGDLNSVHIEKEVRIETVLPVGIKGKVLSALKEAHPYEEPAFDLYNLNNEWPTCGYGMLGDLPEVMDEMSFLQYLKKQFGCGCVRYTELTGHKVKRVAVCGGSGSDLLNKAIRAGADVFISSDFKYHQFFDASKNIVIADIGHFESEQFTKELFFELLTKKMPNFAIHLSNVSSNPINYL